MNAVICGEVARVIQIRDDLVDDIQARFFMRIGDDESNIDGMREVDLFDIRRLYISGEVDLVIIVVDGISLRNVANMKSLIKLFKLHGVERICFIKLKKNGRVWQRMISPRKYWMPQVEVNLVDTCNLNCKCCNHFSNLFPRESFYQLENFANDLQKLSNLVDLETLYFVGGEPFLMKNLDEYLTTAREICPSTSLELLSNGLLILNADKKIFQTLAKTRTFVQISSYPPTAKILDRILNRLDDFGIEHDVYQVNDFARFLAGGKKSDPYISSRNCIQQTCRYMRDGKIYKCAIDALHYRFAEKFETEVKNLPSATSIDLDAPDFIEKLDSLDGIIEMCAYCSERSKFEPWQRSPEPRAEDWEVR